MAPPFTDAAGHPDRMSGRTSGSNVRTFWTLFSSPRKPGGMPTPSRVSSLTDNERAALMLEVRRAGETAASRRLGLSRNTIARALAKLRLLPGSILLIRNALAAIAGEANQRGAA